MGDEAPTQGWGGRTLFDADGDKIGTVGDVFADEHSGEPAWITVHTGLLGRKHTFVPVRGAREVEGGVAVPVEREQVRAAPRVDDDGVLSHDEEHALRRHYGLEARPEPIVRHEREERRRDDDRPPSVDRRERDQDPGPLDRDRGPERHDADERPTPGGPAAAPAPSDGGARAEDGPLPQRDATGDADPAPQDRNDGATDHAAPVPDARFVGRPHVDADHHVVPDRVIDPFQGGEATSPSDDDPTPHEEHHHG